MCYPPNSNRPQLAHIRAVIRDIPRRIAVTVSDPYLSEVVHEVARKKRDAALSHLIVADVGGEGDQPGSITVLEDGFAAVHAPYQGGELLRASARRNSA